MSYFAQRDHVFLHFLTFIPADRPGVALRPILNMIPNHSLFALLNFSIIHSFCILIQQGSYYASVLGIKGIQRDFPGGWLGVAREPPLATPSQPPANPQETPRQPPLKCDQIKTGRRLNFEKGVQLYTISSLTIKSS